MPKKTKHATKSSPAKMTADEAVVFLMAALTVIGATLRANKSGARQLAYRYAEVAFKHVSEEPLS